MEMRGGGEIMQTRLKIALAAAGFALAAIPAFAAEMPTDGSKNFSTPTAAPSYFTNEAVPESARVDRSADFSSEDVAAAPEDGPAVSAGAEPLGEQIKGPWRLDALREGHDKGHQCRKPGGEHGERLRQGRSAGRCKQTEPHKTR